MLASVRPPEMCPFEPVVHDPESSFSADDILQALPTAVIALDSNGVVQRANRRAEELLGVDPRQALWRYVVANCFQSSMNSHDAILKDGRRLTIEISSMNGRSGQLVVLNDVTELRAVESQLSRLQRMSDASQLVGTVAHQLRTPLASALLDASALDASMANPEVAARAKQRLIRRLRHLQELTNDLLGFARAGTMAISPLNVSHLLTELVQDEIPEALSRAIRLTLSPSARDTEILGNHASLKSALLNLFQNAFQAGASRIDVALTAMAENARVSICIQDYGPGMSEAIAAQAFQPLVSGRQGGTGLGLSVAHAIIEAFGGQLQLTKNQPGGCHFEIQLPSTSISTPAPVDPGELWADIQPEGPKL